MNVDPVAKLAGEIVDVNAGAPVDRGRIFAGEETDAHLRTVVSRDRGASVSGAGLRR